MNENVIGKVVLKIHEEEIKEMNEVIKYSPYKIISLNERPLDVIVIPGNLIVTANYIEKNFTLFDENFNKVRKIDRIEDKIVEPYSLAVNNRVRIYIADHTGDQIILTDFEFKKIKSFGSKGSDLSHLDCPCGIFFRNERLYICDYNNKRIQILKSDLEYVQTLSLDYNPWLVNLSERTLCVSRCDSSGGIYFYDLTNNFKLRYTYQKGECRINEINSCFYAFSYNTKKIFSFDSYGVLLEEFTIDRFSHLISNIADGCLVRFNENLLLSFYMQSYFVIFK